MGLIVESSVVPGSGFSESLERSDEPAVTMLPCKCGVRAMLCCSSYNNAYLQVDGQLRV